MSELKNISWWGKNYQWIIGSSAIVFSWVISGIIGFTTAMFGIDSEIDKLREKMIKSESEIIYLKAENSSNKDINARLITIEGDFKYVKQEVNQVSNSNSAIKYLIEIERNKTVNELQSILNRSEKNKSAER